MSFDCGEAGRDQGACGNAPCMKRQAEVAPIDMVLHCPACGMQHIDAPARDSHAWCDECKAPPAAPCYSFCKLWTNPPHRSHLCHGCGHVWRPADVPTNGVAAVKTTGKNDSPIAQPTKVEPQFDVRRILLDVVPGLDGEPVEVYAKSVDDVVKVLTEMGLRLDKVEPADMTDWKAIARVQSAKLSVALDEPGAAERLTAVMRSDDWKDAPAKVKPLTAAAMKRGGRYNWKGQPERLIYLRRFNGWHQFKKIGDPRDVWCEVLDEDLHHLEETAAEVPPAPGMAVQALAKEIVDALLADEKDGGFDLMAGMFGPNFSTLVRRWAALEYAQVVKDSPR